MMADNLRQILKERKLRRQDLADLTGLNKRNLDNKLDLGIGFSEDEIKAIKVALNVSYDELLN